MIFQLLPEKYASMVAFVGILFAFLTTIIATDKLSAFLPKDAGSLPTMAKSLQESPGVQVLYLYLLLYWHLFCLCLYRQKTLYIWCSL